MSNLESLKGLLDWRLLTGSHEFPGPDGGTCLNEAAIVVAGLPYQKVAGLADVPPCFSRPLAMLAIVLNDYAWCDADRQRLIPYVARLANTADTDDVERTRQRFITSELIARMNDLPNTGHACDCIQCLCGAVGVFADEIRNNPRLWFFALAIFDRALAIGRQAEPIETAVIIARADAAKRLAAVS